MHNKNTHHLAESTTPKTCLNNTTKWTTSKTIHVINIFYIYNTEEKYTACHISTIKNAHPSKHQSHYQTPYTHIHASGRSKCRDRTADPPHSLHTPNNTHSVHRPVSYFIRILNANHVSTHASLRHSLAQTRASYTPRLRPPPYMATHHASEAPTPTPATQLPACKELSCLFNRKPNFPPRLLRSLPHLSALPLQAPHAFLLPLHHAIHHPNIRLSLATSRHMRITAPHRRQALTLTLTHKLTPCPSRNHTPLKENTHSTPSNHPQAPTK